MSPQQVDELHARIERLERKRRRAYRALAAVVVVAVVASAVGARKEEPPKAVVSEAFVVRDGQGKIKAWLSLNDNGKPDLSFFDDEKNCRLKLRLDRSDAPSIDFMDKEGTSKMSMSLDKDGGPSLLLRDKDKIRLSLSLAPDGSSHLSLQGKGGGEIHLSSSKDQTGWVVSNRAGKTRMGLVSDESTGLIGWSIYDKNGVSRLSSSVGADGGAGLKLVGPDGNLLFQVPEAPAGKGKNVLNVR